MAQTQTLRIGGVIRGEDNLLCQAAASQLLIIDVQTRLAAAMPTAAEVIHRCSVLAQAAVLLQVPVLASEQYPQGLGSTHEEVAACLPKNTVHATKTRFSCASLFEDRQRAQYVLAGMEAHVCVLQTALELRRAGRAVFVVEDAVCSRNPVHARNALTRMQQAGIIITNTESVLFEWLADARHEHFKAIAALIR